MYNTDKYNNKISIITHVYNTDQYNNNALIRSELAIKDRWYAVVQPKAESILRELTQEDYAFLEEAQPPNRWRKVGL